MAASIDIINLTIMGTTRMQVAVLGGGLQGCCVALALAQRGADVALYERNSTLMDGAATASEGKIHLGYVYASDRSLATARTMLRGSLSFAPLLQSFLETEAPVAPSAPFIYAVHRDSQVTIDDFALHLKSVHELLLADPRHDAYFDIDLKIPPRRLSQAELESQFNPEYVTAAFDTGEVGIDTVALAKLMRQRIEQDPRIELRFGNTITSVENDGDGMRVHGFRASSSTEFSHTFDAVVNALWDGRLTVDATLDIHPGRKWLHRFKHGIRFRLTNGESLPSITLVLGPFGDIVDYGDGMYYMSWYPACMTDCSGELSPPAWQPEPDEPLRSKIVEESFAAMGTFMPAVTAVSPGDIKVKAGDIVAWGHTDIDDNDSELHRRYEIGVHSYGPYHSIDPGKLTMAPHFAELCADRIIPRERTPVRLLTRHQSANV